MQETDFHEVADEFINFANDLSEEWAMPFLSSAFLYAAARYSAFFFLENDGDLANRAQAVDYFCDQYRKMLQESLAELSQERGLVSAED